MLTLKSKLLMLLALGCGVGIGVLSPLQDGMYSAMALFLLPIVFSFLALSIGMDFKKQPAAERHVSSRVTASARPAGRPQFVRSHFVN